MRWLLAELMSLFISWRGICVFLFEIDATSCAQSSEIVNAGRKSVVDLQSHLNSVPMQEPAQSNTRRSWEMPSGHTISKRQSDFFKTIRIGPWFLVKREI